MTGTVKIASSLPMALHISEPEPNPEKPGLTGPLASATLAGTNTTGPDGIGVTRVDRKLWNSFSKSEAFSAYEGHLREVGENDELGTAGYGFEPALAALADDKDNAKAAKQGSLTEEAAPVSAPAMAATSEAPNDGSLVRTPAADARPIGNAQATKAGTRR